MRFSERIAVFSSREMRFSAKIPMSWSRESRFSARMSSLLRGFHRRGKGLDRKHRDEGAGKGAGYG